MIRALLIPLCLTAPMALAETSPPVTIELNALTQIESACRLSFTATSEVGLSQLVLEAVLFDAKGAVDQLTLFDFRDLPAGRMRVRQFDVPGHDCKALSRVLINGMQTCTPEAGGSCEGLPKVLSQTDVEILG